MMHSVKTETLYFLNIAKDYAKTSPSPGGAPGERGTPREEGSLLMPPSPHLLPQRRWRPRGVPPSPSIRGDQCFWTHVGRKTENFNKYILMFTWLHKEYSCFHYRH